MKKKLLILLATLLACLSMTGCELTLEQEDLDRANNAIDAVEKGVDWVASGVDDMLQGKPAKPGASTEEILEQS